MASYNKAILLGRLGKDPVARMTQSGKACTNFSVATTSRVANGQTYEEKTEWHNIVTWGKVAEVCARILKKGHPVFLEGRIQTRKYDKDGVSHSVTEIVADTVQFLQSKQPSDQNGDDPFAGGNTANQSTGQYPSSLDEIPF